MKREVSPIIVAVGILGLLVAIQVVYWQKLGPTHGEVRRGEGRASGGGGSPGSAPEAPAGDPRFHVATLAGAPEAGYRDGPAAEARFDGPADVAALGAEDTAYVADSRNDAIRRVAPDGTVTTVAGGPGRGVFAAPAGVEALPDGSLLVADTGNHRICRVSGGKVTVFAGAETPRDELGRRSGGYEDGPAGEARFRYPVGLAAAEGVVYVADAGNHCVRRIANGVVSTVATAGGRMDTPTGVAEAGGRLYVTDTATGCVWSGSAAGPLSRVEREGNRKLFAGPASVAVVGEEVYVSDAQAHGLYALTPTGVVLVAGEQETVGYADGPGDQARFAQPAGLGAWLGGTVYVADFGNNCIRTVTLPGSTR